MLGVGLGELVEFVGAEVAPAPFGKRKAEFQPALGDNKRQIALHQLLLQGDGCAGYDEALVARLRHDAACEQVGKGFAYACWAFDDGDAFALAVGGFAAFFAR